MVAFSSLLGLLNWDLGRYVHHFVQIQGCGAEAHVNCSFKHFLFFVLELLGRL